MRIYDIIKAKRDGLELSSEEISHFVRGAASGAIPDYQLTALLMAIFLRGMSERETADLTLAIAGSGTCIDLQMPKAVDKHSTGGVGDTTTLVVAPLVAACGVPVAKMTGRGLGHTGGTVDKLESIPGFSTLLSMEQFSHQVKEIGLALISATTELAPADKTLYALRDVTATVDSIPLIASSIMGKKIAAGATHIVLDVKYGAGAFMKSPQQAEELAKAMVDIGRRVGRPTVALLTSMEEPLGNCIGNSLEVEEAISVLSGYGGSPALIEVCRAVALEMLKMYFPELGDPAAKLRIDDALSSGQAFKKFKELVAAQGGTLERGLPEAKITTAIKALQTGYVTRIDPLKLGNVAISLGAGRLRKEDKLDYTAGLRLYARINDYVQAGQTIVIAHSDKPLSSELKEAITSAFELGELNPQPKPNILRIIK